MARVIGSFERVKLLSPSRKDYGDKVTSTRGSLTFEKVAEKLGVDSLPKAIQTIDQVATSKGIGAIYGALTREDADEAKERYTKEQKEALEKQLASEKEALAKDKERLEQLKTKPKDERVSVVRKLQKDFDAADSGPGAAERKRAIRNNQRLILQSLIDEGEIDPSVLDKFPQIGAGAPQMARPAPAPVEPIGEPTRRAPAPAEAIGRRGPETGLPQTGTFGPLGLSLRGGQEPMGQPRLDPDAIDRARRTLGLKLTELARAGNKEGLEIAAMRLPPALRIPVLQDAMTNLQKATGVDRAKQAIAEVADKVVKVESTPKPKPKVEKDYTIRPKSDRPEDITEAIFSAAVDYRGGVEEATPESVRRNLTIKNKIIDYVRTLPPEAQLPLIQKLRKDYEELDPKNPIFRNIETQFRQEREAAQVKEAELEETPTQVKGEVAIEEVEPAQTEFEGMAAAAKEDPLGFYERMKALERQAPIYDLEEKIRARQEVIKAREEAFRQSQPKLSNYLSGGIDLTQLNSRGKVPLTSAQLMALARTATTAEAQRRIMGLIDNVVDKPVSSLYGVGSGTDDYNYAIRLSAMMPKIAAPKVLTDLERRKIKAEIALSGARRGQVVASTLKTLEDIRASKELTPAKKAELEQKVKTAIGRQAYYDVKLKELEERMNTKVEIKVGKNGKIRIVNVPAKVSKTYAEIYQKLKAADKKTTSTPWSNLAFRKRQAAKADADAEAKSLTAEANAAEKAAIGTAEKDLAKLESVKGAAQRTLDSAGNAEQPSGSRDRTEDGLPRSSKDKQAWDKQKAKADKAAAARQTIKDVDKAIAAAKKKIEDAKKQRATTIKEIEENRRTRRAAIEGRKPTKRKGKKSPAKRTGKKGPTAADRAAAARRLREAAGQ